MESSSSPKAIRTNPKGLKILIIISRILVGATFVFSGWSKAIDPWGFIFKIREYLTVWDWDVPYEAIVIGSGTLAIVEFAIGICILSGCLRRVSVWLATAMMAGLLPLTIYIALKNPVQDCGCFGDFLIISNSATLVKNILLTGLIVILLIYNKRIRGLYPAPVQWLVITVACAYPLILALAGYRIQPLVDSRPFKLGTYMPVPVEQPDNENSAEEFIYEKDGVQQAFTLDALPDSTWTYVESENPVESLNDRIVIYDEEGNEVQDEFMDEDSDRLYIIVNHPGIQYLTQAHFANELADYAEKYGVPTAGIIATGHERIKPWRELMRPHFPVYSAEDTTLKELVRGNIAVVYTHGGKIKWKSTISYIDPSLPEKVSTDNLLAEIMPVDDGRVHAIITLIFVGALIFLYLLGLSPKFLRLFIRKRN